ncbi:hypothetical protein [Gordonia sputi]
MIFHDKVILETSVVVGEDDWGNEIIEHTEQTVSADVWPLGTDEKLGAGRDTVIQRYQVAMSRVADFNPDDTKLRITWHGRQFDVDGAIERHLVRGRLHHYEAIGRLTTG